MSHPRNAPPGAKTVHLRNNLYIGNLASADGSELESLLSRFGIVRYAAVVAADGATPGARFGVVEMQTEDQARAAIRTLNGFEIRGQLLTVRWATAPEQTACGHPATQPSATESVALPNESTTTRDRVCTAAARTVKETLWSATALPPDSLSTAVTLLVVALGVNGALS